VSLSGLTFDSRSRLKGIEKFAFYGTALPQLHFLMCVCLISGGVFARVKHVSFSFSGVSENRSLDDVFMNDVSRRFLIRDFGHDVTVILDSYIEDIAEW
jgi:hypothetical protein